MARTDGRAFDASKYQCSELEGNFHRMATRLRMNSTTAAEEHIRFRWGTFAGQNVVHILRNVCGVSECVCVCVCGDEKNYRHRKPFS